MAEKKESILAGTPGMTYHEDAPAIDAAEFQKVIDSRRSVRVFDDTPIPDEVARRCMENALLAPNSSNLQPWEFYRVKSPGIKKEMDHACLGQIAAKSAVELYVVVARTGTWRQSARDMLDLFNRAETETPKMAISYYKKIVPFVYSQGVFGILGFFKRLLYTVKGVSSPIIREPVSKSHLRRWAVKTAALGAENLMLSLRGYGFDSCPMEGFDSRRVKKILGLSRDAAVVMVIGAGKRKEGGIYGPRIRFDSKRYLKEV